MFRKNPPGFHTSLTPEVHDKIIAAVDGVIVQTYIADLVGVPQRSLSEWLTRGEEEAYRGENTVFAHLSLEIKRKQAQIVQKQIARLLAFDNHNPIQWVLERCFPNEFSSDATLRKEFKDSVNFLKNLSGVQPNGSEVKQVDTKSPTEVEQGKTPQSPES